MNIKNISLYIKASFKKYRKDILWIIVLIIAIFFTNKCIDSMHRKFCNDFKKEYFIGRITKKYIDENQHNYEMLVIHKESGIDSLSFNTDNSGFYNFIEVNDSIIKIKNSNEIKIINKDTSFYINFNCN